MVLIICLLSLLAFASALPTVPLQVDEDVAFGLSLLNQLELNNGIHGLKNLIIAPNGIKNVLAMVLAGAKGQTAEQIESVIGASSLTRPFRGETDYAKSMNLLAVQSYSSNNYKPNPAYFKLLQTHFKAEKRYEAFHTYVNIWATNDINQWIANNTNQLLNNFYNDPYELSILTKVVLVNAEYFHGTWLYPISKQNTKKEIFVLSDGQEKLVEMMNFMGLLNYAQFDDGQLVEIPFKNDGLEMLAFLPNQEKLENYHSISSLFASIPLEERLSKMTSYGTYMKLPKLQSFVNSSLLNGQSLKPFLQKLGIVDVFQSGKADLSGINFLNNMNLNDVKHQAILKWDETSAEGEAGTGGDVDVPSAFVDGNSGIFPTIPVINFALDKPFLFLIRDTNQGQPKTLFSGVINDPDPSHF